MSRRLQLHNIFIDLLGTRGEELSRVYFQPPPKVKMKYPCILYNRTALSTEYANNELYKSRQGYSVTVIDADPDSLIPGKVAALPLCRFDRWYAADNLNHDVYTLYY